MKIVCVDTYSAARAALGTAYGGRREHRTLYVAAWNRGRREPGQSEFQFTNLIGAAMKLSDEDAVAAALIVVDRYTERREVVTNAVVLEAPP